MKKAPVAGISLALVALLGLASCIGTQSGAPAAPQQQQGGMMGGQDRTMGGQGGMTVPEGTAGAPAPYRQPSPYEPGGMMGSGMMGAGMMGSGSGMTGGIMGGSGDYGSQGATLTPDKAAAAVRLYLKAYGPGLSVAEVMEFDRNFYAEVEEEGTGTHAMELLIDKRTGRVYPETGPNMVWNTRYSAMGRMMGISSVGEGPMPVTPQRALELAQQSLDNYMPGLTVSDADTFYGYYTLHTLRDGRVEGMLSVNGHTGAVWYHDWHGPFVGMAEFGKANGH